MLNINCIGHLGADAECKNTNGKDFSVFRIADTNKWTDDAGVVHEETTWVDCIINGKPNVLQYLKKGQQVFVSGSCSLRVYSSAKERCMKAGISINVRQIELLGGKSDDVPSMLYTEDGTKAISVAKYYHAADAVRDVTGPESLTLVSRSGSRFNVTREGWVSKITEPAQ